MPPTGPDYLATNRAMWDERVGIHASSAFYAVDDFKTHRDCLRPFEIAEVGEVSDRSLLHLQCHFGLDTMSWATRGAQVTGLDFSPAAVDRARQLAAELDIDARFVVSDVYGAVEALAEETFDIVYTGIGALCWLPDIRGWAETVAQLLHPGGFLYLAEFHPLLDSMDDDTGRTVVRDYFDTAPQTEEAPGSYADREAETVHNTSVYFHHPLGDIVTALTDVGLRLEFLHEHRTALFQRFAQMHESDGVWTLPGEAPSPPLMFSLRASKT